MLQRPLEAISRLFSLCCLWLAANPSASGKGLSCSVKVCHVLVFTCIKN